MNNDIVSVKMHKGETRTIKLPLQDEDSTLVIDDISSYTAHLYISDENCKKLLLHKACTKNTTTNRFETAITQEDTYNLGCGDFIWIIYLIYPSGNVKPFVGTLTIDKYGVDKSWLNVL